MLTEKWIKEQFEKFSQQEPERSYPATKAGYMVALAIFYLANQIKKLSEES